MRIVGWIAGLLFALTAHAADEPGPAAFAWRATLDTAGQGGLVRVPLPGEALARLQSRSAADLRVFDGQGQPVPFALAKPPQPPEARRQETPAFRALPLYAAQAGGRLPKGMVQLRVDEKGAQRSLWVQLGQDGPQPAPGTQRLQAALFDTRAQKDPVSALVLKARVPDNVPVQFTLSTSSDLANWTPVTAQGRVFRFAGEGAPANDRLELEAPLALRDRFLRVEWNGQPGVALESMTGLLAASTPQPELPALVLPAGTADGPAALEWQLGFSTPIARIELSTSRDNTLLPVRIFGRTQPSEPWRLLANTVVYRLGSGANQGSNTAAALQHPSVRWLRVEATHGMRLEGVPLAARVLFEPVDVVFPAGAAGPYQLVAGREATTAAALPIGMLAATTTTAVDALPAARIASVQAAAGPRTGFWTPWLPRGVDNKTAGLWAVLLAGVLLLGGVAWSLLRQVNARPQG